MLSHFPHFKHFPSSCSDTRNSQFFDTYTISSVYNSMIRTGASTVRAFKGQVLGCQPYINISKYIHMMNAKKSGKGVILVPQEGSFWSPQTQTPRTRPGLWPGLWPCELPNTFSNISHPNTPTPLKRQMGSSTHPHPLKAKKSEP